FTRHLVSNDSRRVRVHVHDGGDETLTTSLLYVPAAANEHHSRPDVGGVYHVTGPREVPLVMQIDDGTPGYANTATSGIGGTTVLLGGIPSLGTPWVIASATTRDYERPSISQVENRL